MSSNDWNNAGGNYVTLTFAPSGPRSGDASNYSGGSSSSAQPGSGIHAPPPILSDSGSLASYSQCGGQSFYFRVTGGTDGAIWGTDVYMHDSTPAAAAVHSGALQAGETGVVKVTMLPALPRYHGSTNSGVTSQPWENEGSYVSYQVERACRVRFRAPATQPDQRATQRPNSARV